MILGIDVGATKTLLGLFNEHGDLKQKQRLLTNDKYDDFLPNLVHAIASFTDTEVINNICLAMPGRIDRKKQTVVAFGHRPWKNIPIAKDLAKALHFDSRKILLENDANLAGLAEAHLYKSRRVVVYVTISTGVGTAIVTDGALNPYFLNSEGGQTLLLANGRLRQWDDFESGSGIAEHYHKLASQIESKETWNEISRYLAAGLSGFISLLQPELVILGGSVGIQLKKFKAPLIKHLSSMQETLVPIPDIKPAKHGEDSVLYGCYHLAKQQP